MGGASSSSTEPRRAGALGRGRGPTRRAVRKALQEARDDERMTVEHEVRALIAERCAELVDRASAAGDEAALLRASTRLLEVLDRLPLRVADGGGAGDGDAGGAVLSLFNGGPEMGNSSHA